MADENSADKMVSQRAILETRIALAVQEKAGPGQCPSAEQLAAFTEGQLAGKDREAIVVHLSECSDCRDEWLAVVSLFAAEDEEKAILEHLALTDQEETTNDIDPARKSIRARKNYSLGIPTTWCTTAGLALAACLVLVLTVVFQAPKMSFLITSSYDLYQRDVGSSPQNDLGINLLLPWERIKGEYPSASGPLSSLPSRAFAAGLWLGKAQLTGKAELTTPPDFLTPQSTSDFAARPWEESSYKTYYWIGRWVLLLKASCLAPQSLSDDFWAKQISALEAARKDLLGESKAEHESRLILECLQTVQPILQSLRKDSASLPACQNLAREVNGLIYKLTMVAE